MCEFALETAAFAASHTSRRTWLCRHAYRQWSLARAIAKHMMQCLGSAIEPALGVFHQTPPLQIVPGGQQVLQLSIYPRDSVLFNFSPPFLAKLTDELAWDHFGRWFHPTDVWIGPLTSSNISTSSDSSISFRARNFLPDLSGLTSRILLSAELLSIHCVLILESLYSFTMDPSDSRRLALLV